MVPDFAWVVAAPLELLAPYVPSIYRTLEPKLSSLVLSATHFVGAGDMMDTVSPATRDLPWVSSPAPMALCILLYLSIVGCAVLKNAVAPASCEPAPPGAFFRGFIVAHNAFLSLLSLYMCIAHVAEAFKGGYSVWGNEYRPGETAMARAVYVFYMSKFLEFFDTFIMIAKGSYRQVSFLHVYHHSTIAIIWWVIVRTAPGGDVYYSAALNSWVHVVMYFYYLCSSILSPGARKRYLWWGKYLTQMQMLQFLTNFLQASHNLVFGYHVRFLNVLLLVYMTSLLALFGNFYVQRWAAGGKRKDA